MPFPCTRKTSTVNELEKCGCLSRSVCTFPFGFVGGIPIWGWSGGAMVLGKLPVPGRPTDLLIVGQGLTALALGAGGGCLDIFSLVYHFSLLSPSLWETA